MAIRLNQVGNKAGRIMATVRNGEASASIPRGAPLVLKLSDTAVPADDGLKVVLPSTAGNGNSYGLKYGVAMETFGSGVFSESILFGQCGYTLITRATRAASSDSWTSSASIASGVGLGIDTINNAFLLGASIAASIASNHHAAVMLDSVASFAASATATSDTRTVMTAAVRSFVRMM